MAQGRIRLVPRAKITHQHCPFVRPSAMRDPAWRGRALSALGAVAWLTMIASCSGGGARAVEGATDDAGNTEADNDAAPDDANTEADNGAAPDPQDGACGGPVEPAVADTHCASPDGGRGYDVPPHSGIDADDDDCTLHVSIDVPCLQRDEAAGLTIKVTAIGTTTPATGASPLVDAVIGNHPIPNVKQIVTEMDGVYDVSPFFFDRSGRWTVTFHLYETVPAKHAHVSFYVDVP